MSLSRDIVAGKGGFRLASPDFVRDLAKKREKEILDEIREWDYAQKPKLSVEYYTRKKNKRFKAESQELFDIMLFLYSGDYSHLEKHLWFKTELDKAKELV